MDIVIVSRGLWESGRVRGTAILDTPQERGLSDHVPLWVEIEVGEEAGGHGGLVEEEANNGREKY